MLTKMLLFGTTNNIISQAFYRYPVYHRHILLLLTDYKSYKWNANIMTHGIHKSRMGDSNNLVQSYRVYRGCPFTASLLLL